MKHSEEQIATAYDIARQVYDGGFTASAGQQLLHELHDININSAADYIRDYGHMMRGEVFHRAMGAPAIDYFLTHLRHERGDKHHRTAIAAVELHIDYFENIKGREVNLNKLRAVVQKHRLVTLPLSLAEHEAAFKQQVEQAMNDAPAVRQARLAKASKTPVRVVVTTTAFQRNSDVVVEVLRRANGSCERCSLPAPFSRKRDGTPYLEVHHVVQLANGGEDTVENALALCPNCHRELHYGAHLDGA